MGRCARTSTLLLISKTFAVFFVLGCYSPLAHAQLTVSPSRLEFRMVQGGPLPPPQSFSVSSTAGLLQWTATIPENSRQFLRLSVNSGTTPASPAAYWEGWWAAGQQPGQYSTTITLAASGASSVTVDVTLTVVPKAAGPSFTYPSGPVGCSKPQGYPDDAVCTVPDEKPPGTFSPPPVGKTYADPNFGAQVRTLTGPVFRHAYSTPSPISAGNKHVLVFTPGLQTRIISSSTGAVVADPVPAGVNTGTYWDAFDDDIYYFLSGASVKQYNIRTRKLTTVIDYSISGHGFSSITSGGTGDGSKDNWISFFAPSQKTVCALDLNSVKSYCADYGSLGPVPISFVDFTLISRGLDAASGKRYVLLMANPAMAVFSVNLGQGRLDLEFRGPEDPEGNGNHNGTCEPGERCFGAPHADVFEDSAGMQYIVTMADTQTPCERALATYQLNKGTLMRVPVELGGGKRTIMTVYKCGTKWGGDHIGCAKSSPYCVISTNFQDLRDPGDQTPIQPTPHIAEIFVMRDNGAEIRRLVKHRSVLYKNEEASGYWSRPRAAISNDGAYVVADSNFGLPDQQKVVLISTGFGKPRVASRLGVVNSASFNPLWAPGGYVTVLGSSLTDQECTANAPPDQFPLPLVLCGTSVTFNGQAARLHYADPWQLNVIPPDTVSPGGNVQVVVRRTEDASSPYEVPGDAVLVAAPAIFSYVLGDGVARAVVVNWSDISLNGPSGWAPNSRPLRPGEHAVLFANGLGPTNPAVPAGYRTPGTPLSRTALDVQVLVNGVPQTVGFAGLTPSLSALYQVNFQLNSATPISGGDQDVIWLVVGGAESPRLAISLSSTGQG